MGEVLNTEADWNSRLMAAGGNRRQTCSISLPLHMNAKNTEIHTESTQAIFPGRVRSSGRKHQKPVCL